MGLFLSAMVLIRLKLPVNKKLIIKRKLGKLTETWGSVEMISILNDLQQGWTKEVTKCSKARCWDMLAWWRSKLAWLTGWNSSQLWHASLGPRVNMILRSLRPMGNHSGPPAHWGCSQQSQHLVCEHLNWFWLLSCFCNRQKIINVLVLFAVFFSLPLYQSSHGFSNLNHHKKHLDILFSADADWIGLGWGLRCSQWFWEPHWVSRLSGHLP